MIGLFSCGRTPGTPLHVALLRVAQVQGRDRVGRIRGALVWRRDGVQLCHSRHVSIQPRREAEPTMHSTQPPSDSTQHG